MTYPPPPGLAFLAYQLGSITKAEFEHMLKLWYEEHPKSAKEDGNV